MNGGSNDLSEITETLGKTDLGDSHKRELVFFNGSYCKYLFEVFQTVHKSSSI
jgi:hypothetical protein